MDCDNPPGGYKYFLAEEICVVGQTYSQIHGYVMFTICIPGILTNIVNIILLTKPHARTPTNALLGSLAIFDILTMFSQLPHVAHFYISNDINDLSAHTQGPIEYLHFAAIFGVLTHSIAVYITVGVLAMRFIILSQHSAVSVWTKQGRVLKIIAAIIAFCLSVNFLNMINYQVKKINLGNTSIYILQEKQGNDAIINVSRFNFWLQAIINRLFPCVIMVLLSILVVRKLSQINRGRTALYQSKTDLTTNSVNTSLTETTNRKVREQNARHKSTTRMLLIVALLFLLSEVPNGILVTLNGILDRSFRKEIYNQLGDILDLFTMINCAINFSIYCIMSARFRQDLKNLFGCETLRRRREATRNIEVSQMCTEVPLKGRRSPEGRLCAETSTEVQSHQRLSWKKKRKNKRYIEDSVSVDRHEHSTCLSISSTMCSGYRMTSRRAARRPTAGIYQKYISGGSPYSAMGQRRHKTHLEVNMGTIVAQEILEERNNLFLTNHSDE